MNPRTAIPSMTERTLALGVRIVDPAPPREFVYSRAGYRLHGFDWGGTGPAVLLLHGGRLTARTWDFVCLGLRGDARLVALDLRGHGDSDWSDDYRVATMADDVIAAADHLGFDRVHLVGMSLGGTVAAHLAEAHPGRVERLVLVDVAPGTNFESTRRMRAFIEGLRPVHVLDTVVDGALGVNPRADRAGIAYRMSTLFRRGSDGVWVPKADPTPPDYPGIMAAIERFPVQLTGLPVLLVRGERSRALPQPAAERLVATLPDGRLVVVPNAGHNVQEDNPAALIDALRTFLIR